MLDFLEIERKKEAPNISLRFLAGEIALAQLPGLYSLAGLLKESITVTPLPAMAVVGRDGLLARRDPLLLGTVKFGPRRRAG